VKPQYQKPRLVTFTEQEFLKRLSKYAAAFNVRVNEQIEELVVMNRSVIIKTIPKK
jgi:hypothetical protein